MLPLDSELIAAELLLDDLFGPCPSVDDQLDRVAEQLAEPGLSAQEGRRLQAWRDRLKRSREQASAEVALTVDALRQPAPRPAVRVPRRAGTRRRETSTRRPATRAGPGDDSSGSRSEPGEHEQLRLGLLGRFIDPPRRLPLAPPPGPPRPTPLPRWSQREIDEPWWTR
jgi:hypothetical protein